MQRNKCLNCGLVNISGKEICLRCKASLSGPPPRQDAKFWLPLESVNGIGVRLYDQQRLSDQIFTATRWITFFYVPLMPLSTITFRPIEWERTARGETMQLEIYQNSALDLKRVLRTYGISLSGVLPLTLSLAALFTGFMPKLDTLVMTFIIVALTLWFVFVTYKLENNKIY